MRIFDIFVSNFFFQFCMIIIWKKFSIDIFFHFFKHTIRWNHKYFCIVVSWCCFIDFSFNVSQTKLEINFKILRKNMFATSRNDYTEIFMTSTICMFEKMIKTSIENFFQIIIIQNWKKKFETKISRIRKRFFHAKFENRAFHAKK